MRLPKFDYRQPKTIQDASAILLDQPAAKAMAGGTDLLVTMKHRVETPSAVVSLKALSVWNYVQKENGTLKIGALNPLKRVYLDPNVARKLPALAVAARPVGSYHHQIMGTIGGNLCQQTRCKYCNQSKRWRSARPLSYKAGGEICHVAKKEGVCYSTYCGDVAPALLVLNAEVVVLGKEGSRQIPLESICSGEGKRPLNFAQGEIITEIVIPEQAAEGFSTDRKFANRGSVDFPIVGAGFWTSAATRESVRKKLLECIADEMEANPEDLVANDGNIFVKGSPDISMPFVKALKVYQYGDQPMPLVGRASWMADTSVRSGRIRT